MPVSEVGQTLGLSGIGKSFGPTRALDDISFAASPGEIVAITGSSGSGKTTLCRIVSGLEQPDRGKVTLGGRDVTEAPCGERRIAFLFETYALYPQLSVYENVASPLKAPNARRRLPNIQEEIAPVLELLEIAHLAGRHPAELSGGQKQRVGLARALVQRPSLLLLDEPIAHLDAKLRHKLRGEIRRRLKDRPCPAIWTTPDALEAMSVADRVAVLHNGRLEQIGTPEEIWLRPATTQVARLLGDPPMNLIRGSVTAGEGGPRFECESFSMPLPALGGIAAPRGVVLGMRPDAISLHAPGAAGMMVGEIYAHEPFGKYAIVTVRNGETLVKIKTGTTDAKPIGSMVGLTLDPTRVTVFDAQTELLVASAPQHRA